MAPSEPAGLLVRQAARFRDAKDFPAARRLLSAAAAREPANPDHRIAVAHTYIDEDNLAAALAVYDEILADWPGDRQALVLRAVYGSLAGRSTTADWASLLDRHPAYGRWWHQLHSRVRLRESMILSSAIPEAEAYVVLGYQLPLAAQLHGRLEVALAAARRYPGARFLLSGGRAGDAGTEAKVMLAWLHDRDVSPSRMLLEDRSVDTIENALFSLSVAADAGIREVAVISSASHSIRAAALFDAADEVRGRSLLPRVTPAHHVSAGLPPGLTVAREQLAGAEPLIRMYRDILRLGGIWAIPGHRR
jgi:DUF218 domain-containing protein/tetratricopeptide repeat protein